MDLLAPPPEGFEPHVRKSPVTDPWEPLYARTTDDAVILGLRAAQPHANGRGFVHGGLISALADNAMGLSCARRLGGEASLITVSLSLHFLAAAQMGQWLAFETAFVRPGATLCFAQAFVTADGAPCARADGVFRVVRRPPSPG
ncbi:MAG: PaaI family thioesterase [Phenylobacterium sp.]|uniref:PaaI family thioesterase n=1 Tax=Phenylobacterium sp. TaxID=1871053 RepID=UPI00271EDAAF|nr:PaaI family thioesterase [Phenylobacterium sp.]MDO8901941.1 PaaI family thioesterase [Phenylobacterium sp.]MDP2212365.1 PaaI family thioesterase [Phenylobacterium sp.]